jgi:hypothetical protein
VKNVLSKPRGEAGEAWASHANRRT